MAQRVRAIGAVQLPIGYFANVIDIGGIGLGICTDGVGSKAIVAEMMRRYDTIGIDCIAMNVNDLLCVGAKPLSLVDYIAVERADAAMLDGIAIGLAEGARQAGISISGGEIAQLRDVISGFDLVGTAVGTVPLDRIIVGRGVRPGDRVIGLASNGLHSNGYTLARRVLFEQAELSVDDVVPELGGPLGEELLRPTLIYVREILEARSSACPSRRADPHYRRRAVEPAAGRCRDRLCSRQPAAAAADLRPDRTARRRRRAEMFEVYNMGIGFCVVLPEARCRGGAGDPGPAWPPKPGSSGRRSPIRRSRCDLPAHGLIGSGKRFRAA